MKSLFKFSTNKLFIGFLTASAADPLFSVSFFLFSSVFGSNGPLLTLFTVACRPEPGKRSVKISLHQQSAA